MTNYKKSLVWFATVEERKTGTADLTIDRKRFPSLYHHHAIHGATVMTVACVVCWFETRPTKLTCQQRIATLFTKTAKSRSRVLREFKLSCSQTGLARIGAGGAQASDLQHFSTLQQDAQDSRCWEWRLDAIVFRLEVKTSFGVEWPWSLLDRWPTMANCMKGCGRALPVPIAAFRTWDLVECSRRARHQRNMLL